MDQLSQHYQQSLAISDCFNGIHWGVDFLEVSNLRKPKPAHLDRLNPLLLLEFFTLCAVSQKIKLQKQVYFYKNGAVLFLSNFLVIETYIELYFCLLFFSTKTVNRFWVLLLWLWKYKYLLLFLVMTLE